MKFKITMKDPDGVYMALVNASVANDKTLKELSAHCGKWFKYGEYLTVEIDTETETITVCEV